MGQECTGKLGSLRQRRGSSERRGGLGHVVDLPGVVTQQRIVLFAALLDEAGRGR